MEIENNQPFNDKSNKVRAAWGGLNTPANENYKIKRMRKRLEKKEFSTPSIIPTPLTKDGIQTYRTYQSVGDETRVVVRRIDPVADIIEISDEDGIETRRISLEAFLAKYQKPR